MRASWLDPAVNAQDEFARLSGRASVDQRWAAIAYRVRGEAFEVLGRLDDAVEAYTAALSFNPKVGVQRRMAALKKRAQHSLTGFPNIVSKRAHL